LRNATISGHSNTSWVPTMIYIAILFVLLQAITLSSAQNDGPTSGSLSRRQASIFGSSFGQIPTGCESQCGIIVTFSKCTSVTCGCTNADACLSVTCLNCVLTVGPSQGPTQAQFYQILLNGLTQSCVAHGVPINNFTLAGPNPDCSGGGGDGDTTPGDGSSTPGSSGSTTPPTTGSTTPSTGSNGGSTTGGSTTGGSTTGSTTSGGPAIAHSAGFGWLGLVSLGLLAIHALSMAI